MEIFRDSLKKFVNNQADLAELTRKLWLSLNWEPGNVEQIKKALLDLSQQDIISTQVSSELLRTIDRFQVNTTPRSRAPIETATRQARDDSVAEYTPARRIFPELLKQFSNDSLAYIELETGLIQDLDADPSSHDDYLSALQQLVAQEIISQQIFSSLLATLQRIASAEEDTDQARQDIDQAQEGLQQAQPDLQRALTRAGTSSAAATNRSEPDQGAVGIGTLLKNRFRIIELIGHGGMGSVYKAEDQMMVAAKDVVTEVAVKVLNKSFREHPEAFQILHREALKTRSLAHPHIVNVFDCDRDGHNIFMTMELMHGLRLDDALDKNPHGFEFEDAKRFIVEMADALQNAHKGGIIHSDLRPGNIFLSSGKIKLFDFGMARAIRLGGAETTGLASYKDGERSALTPTYASPEMLENSAEPDPRDDIYAMGCLSYEMLTGKHPFVEDGAKIPATLARERGLKPARISKLKSRQWDAIKGCLEFERSKRTKEVDIFLNKFLLQRRAIQVFPC